jgi:hypothetical protein
VRLLKIAAKKKTLTFKGEKGKLRKPSISVTN